MCISCVVLLGDYVPFAADNNLITPSEASQLNQTAQSCVELIATNSPLAQLICNTIISGIQQDGNNFNGM